MASADDAQAVAAVTAYQSANQSVRAHLDAYITQLWRSLGKYGASERDKFVKQIVPIVLGAERQMSSTTSAYLTAQRARELGTSVKPAAINQKNVTGAGLRNGVDPRVVYARPFNLVWRELAQGVDPTKAIESGRKRAILTGVTDLQLAKTRTSQQVVGNDKHVVGYRRVLKGEKNCALCIVASTQRYHTNELLPIHPGCDCDIAEIYGHTDPGRIIDKDLLQAAHEAVAKQFGISDSAARHPDYSKLIVVQQHGELGPVLTVAGHHFTGPEQLNSGLDLGGLPRL